MAPTPVAALSRQWLVLRAQLSAVFLRTSPYACMVLNVVMMVHGLVALLMALINAAADPPRDHLAPSAHFRCAVTPPRSLARTAILFALRGTHVALRMANGSVVREMAPSRALEGLLARV
jgi:hypothetical protein